MRIGIRIFYVVITIFFLHLLGGECDYVYLGLELVNSKATQQSICDGVECELSNNCITYFFR